MSFAAGVYSLPGPALNTGDTVSATENNTFRNDVATAFNLTWLRNGTAAATADIPMGGYSFTNCAAVGSNGSLLLKVNNGTTAATLDTSGNLGLGVTPSAWGTFTNVFQNQGGAVASSGVNNIRIFQNSYYNGTNYIYRTTEAASRYDQQQGVHVWFNAPSGTAGNAISFTQAMTLNASGNLGIGTTSPDSRLHALDSVNNAGLRIGYNSTSVNYYDADTQIFRSGTSTERARIDSSGNLLVGNTTGTSYASQGFNILGGLSNSQMFIGHASGTASGQSYIIFTYNGSGSSGNIGSITQSGTTGVLYNITSDYRLKTVTGVVSGHGERIDALEPVEYTWNSDGSVARGFLAHKFQEVYPSSVNGEKDDVDENGNPKYQTMQASTSEVIADLVAEIKSLRIRIAALET